MVIERFNRTLMTRIRKKFTENNTHIQIRKVLTNVIDYYNNVGINRTIGITPGEDLLKKNKSKIN